jgi:hypothetical protein
MQACDPSPGAPNTCPAGYHCAPDGHCDAFCTPGGGECGAGYTCTPDGRCKGDGECTGLECNIVDCNAQGKPSTTIKGTVFAPNGSLPLYGITVYVPNAPVGALPDGAQCSRCSEDLPGSPIARATTDEAGNFEITNAPSGANIPLVITSGKWRRQITVSTVAECSDTTVAAADTRLPKTKSEGDIPRIAITTGNADALECLVRKMGIDDSEFTTGTGDGRVHMYAGNGANQFASGFPGGSGSFSSASDFWNAPAKLDPYDIVILSCEGSQRPETKMQVSLDAMKSYADRGGRVFASHWHNIWIGGNFQGSSGIAPQVWTQVATWGNSSNLSNAVINNIDEVNNPKGPNFATWMLNVMGSTVRGEIPIQAGTARVTALTVDAQRAERWTYLDINNTLRPQNFQFTTPNEQPIGDRCGKVVFSDMHVSGDSRSRSGTPFPNDCSNAPLTPQEKALAFMLFDLASCVGVLL